MIVLQDGNPLLNNISILNIGSDTVILYDELKNTLYICAHLKDYKSEDTNNIFIKQMHFILNIINFNKNKCVILMMDTAGANMGETL
jgi:hypothetical protein